MQQGQRDAPSSVLSEILPLRMLTKVECWLGLPLPAFLLAQLPSVCSPLTATYLVCCLSNQRFGYCAAGGRATVAGVSDSVQCVLVLHVVRCRGAAALSGGSWRPALRIRQQGKGAWPSGVAQTANWAALCATSGFQGQRCCIAPRCVASACVLFRCQRPANCLFVFCVQTARKAVFFTKALGSVSMHRIGALGKALASNGMSC